MPEFYHLVLLNLGNDVLRARKKIILYHLNFIKIILSHHSPKLNQEHENQKSLQIRANNSGVYVTQNPDIYNSCNTRDDYLIKNKNSGILTLRLQIFIKTVDLRLENI